MDCNFELFMCGLCNHLVTPNEKMEPLALQCVGCGGLYCEGCVNSQMMWSCPKISCKCKEHPPPIHYKVKEVIEVIKIFCPGCNKPFKYAEIWKHVQVCDGREAIEARMQTESQIQGHINYNLQKIHGLEVPNKTDFANDIFILDKDRLKIFVYSRLTNTFSEHKLEYEPSAGQQAPVSKQSGEKALPHNNNYV